MNKTISMSIRVSEEELDKLKQAARLEAYASYSEFIRRTALIEAENVLKRNKEGKEINY
ncbi:MAG: plasmid mobilization protein [Thomasclavelia spiroformis]